MRDDCVKPVLRPFLSGARRSNGIRRTFPFFGGSSNSLAGFSNLDYAWRHLQFSFSIEFSNSKKKWATNHLSHSRRTRTRSRPRPMLPIRKRPATSPTSNSRKRSRGRSRSRGPALPLLSEATAFQRSSGSTRSRDASSETCGRWLRGGCEPAPRLDGHFGRGPSRCRGATGGVRGIGRCRFAFMPRTHGFRLIPWNSPPVSGLGLIL